MSAQDPGADKRLSTEIERIRGIIRRPHTRNFGAAARQVSTGIRPANAASLILLDRRGTTPRILMGRRHHSLKFMPGALVFPGGRVDPADGSIRTADELPERTMAQIKSSMRGRPSARGARALGLAAIREMAEETGILIGRDGQPQLRHRDWQPFLSKRIVPSLGGLRLLARAITPPGPPRRFDTWFFVADAEIVGYLPDAGFAPSGELEALQWISPADAIKADTREITRVVLVELMNRLQRDGELDPAYPAPFYRVFRKRFIRSLL